MHSLSEPAAVTGQKTTVFNQVVQGLPVNLAEDFLQGMAQKLIVQLRQDLNAGVFDWERVHHGSAGITQFFQ